MRKVLYIILCWLSLNLFSQVKISSGEYWFDNSRSQIYTIDVSAESNLIINDDIEVGHLNDGLHSITSRFSDEKGFWSSPVSKYFVKFTVDGYAEASEIKAYEFWFDRNYSEKQFEQSNNMSGFSVIGDADVSGLRNGLHTVHIRFLDNRNIWSSVVSRFFIKQGAFSVSDNIGIDAYEYWFDKDFDLRTYVNEPFTETFMLDGLSDVSNLIKGLHTIHFRSRDTRGVWSSVISRFFIHLTPIVSETGNKIVDLEYWIDDLLNERVTKSFNAQEILVMNEIDASSLFEGIHTLHFRFKDAANKYSPVVSRFFIYQEPALGLQNNGIVAYRYWLNDKAIHTVEIENEASDLMFMDSVNLRSYAKGEYMLNMQFRDARGKWSSTVSDTITKLSFPFAELQFESTDICRGDSTLIRAFTVDVDSLVWDFGEEEVDTGSTLMHMFKESGEYHIELKVFDTTEQIAKVYKFDPRIVLHDLPLAELQDSVVITEKENTSLDATSGFVSYSWNDIPGDASYLISGPDLGVGEYPVYLTVEDNWGCRNSDTTLIVVQSTQGFKLKQAFKLKVYPNPASRYVVLEWDETAINDIHVSFVDMNGRIRHEFDKVNSGQMMSTGQLSRGNYLLLITLRERLITVPVEIKD